MGILSRGGITGTNPNSPFLLSGTDIVYDPIAALVTRLILGGSDFSVLPVSQTLTATSVTGGTVNVPGASLTIKPGNGTGTGAPSTIIFQAPVVVGGGGGFQTMATRMTISGTAITGGVPFLSSAGSAAAPGFAFSAATDLGMYQTGGTLLGLSVGGTGRLTIDANRTIVVNRLEQSQGINVASANNLVLGADGNYFPITGAVQINLIDNTNWQGGSIVRLKFASTPTVKNNFAVSGNNKPILLAGAVDFVATANDVLTLMYDSADASWYEVSRSLD